MKKLLFPFILFTLNFYQYTYAKTIQFTTQAIPEHQQYLSGQLPLIKTRGFESLNQKMTSILLANSDEVRIEFATQLLYLDENFLTLQIHKEIQGGRSYSREKYFVIDLKKKELLTLPDILDRYHISADTVEHLLADKLNNAINSELSEENFDEHLLTSIANFYSQYPEIIHINNETSFYLKDNLLGISFDIDVASYAFEFKIRHQTIEPN